ncbi:MAG: chemotaxis protein CheW [Acidobacteriota bacterium]
MAQNIDREVMLGFVEEARGYLPRILEGIDQLSRDPQAGQQLEETHRLTHSIKGAASMLGLSGLAHIAYFLEEALEQIAAGQLVADADAAEVLSDTAANIGRYLDQLAAGHPEERPLVAQVVQAFRRLRGLPEAGDEAEIERLCPADASSSPAPAPSAPIAKSQPTPPSPPAPAYELDDAAPSADLLEAFRDEAADHLAKVSAGLRQLEQDPGDPAPLRVVRRTVHTLKGAAAMVGRPRCAGLAHRMEDLLDHLHDAEAAPDADQLKLLFATTDALEDLTSADPGAQPSLELETLYDQYDAMLGTPRSPTDDAGELRSALGSLGETPLLDLTETAPQPEASTPAPAGQGPMVRVPIARLDEVVRLISELVVSGSEFERHFQQLSREVAELGLSTDRLKRLSHRFESDYEAFALTQSQEPLAFAAGSAGPALEPNSGTTLQGLPMRPVSMQPIALSSGALSSAQLLGHTEFDELELDRYTELHRVSRQLSESSNDLGTLESGLSHRLGDFEGYLSRVSRLTGEIQDKLMRLRMVPLAQLATRLHRTVRVTAEKQGKQATLVIEGENTALDKTVLEEISDPLLHLLRNAVDHGIEPPSLRRVLGKPERGQIRLRAYHQGTQVVIEVNDDGGGLDEDKLRAKAVEAGWVSETEAAQAAPEALHQLIFEPGFSTATEVSEVSGRGVGLDVVQAVVHRLEGTLAVHSAPGRGITFIIRLPLTLAVIRAVMVRSGDQTYALPLSPVRQILRLEEHDLEQLGKDPVVRVRDQAYPAVRLHEVLGQPASTEADQRRNPALILDLGERSIALLVDRIVEARDVVVKNLGSLLQRVPAVTGATLMGDGSVVLILNPQQLGGVEAPAEPRLRPTTQAPEPRRRSLDVMVVDDSVSVRRVLSNLLRGQGWNPITARDGVEALETLQRQPQLPAAMLLDIEMPRMDGYELTATLRAHDIYRELPIIMLTSRSGDKHRQRAFEIGATEYLVKPYQDEVLINLLKQLSGISGIDG